MIKCDIMEHYGGFLLTEKLIHAIESHGDRGAIVPFSRILDLKRDMTDLKNGGYQSGWLRRMVNHVTDDSNKFIPSDIKFEPCSLISVLMFSPKVLLQFHYRGRPVNCVVPPQYTDWELNNNRVFRYLSDFLAPFGFSVAQIITLPQKMLAVHCGLGSYGRNNICYNGEFGSYMQIMTYASDLRCGEEAWFPLTRMKECDNCQACVKSCPTGAIDSERRLIDPERCITNIDESPGEFPAWLDKKAHNSIVGCVKCQDACPANAPFRDDVKIRSVFTEGETNEILNHGDNDSYTDCLAAKLKATGIPHEYIEVLPRNLAVLLDKE